MFILYCLTFSNGKKYIGQTVRAMNTRIAQHGASANRGSLLPAHCAWRLHGKPKVEVLAEFATHEELHAAEIAAIASMKTLCPDGYNVGMGGETAPSKNPEVAAKIAAKATGRKYKNTEVWVASSIEMWKNPEYQKKVSDGLKASWNDERRAASSARMQAMWEKRKADGWAVQESTKEKLRGRVHTEETRKKMSASAKGKPKAPRSQETLDKIAANTKMKWQDAEHAERRVAAIKAAWDVGARSAMGTKAAASWLNPEIRAKRIESMRAAAAAKKQPT